MGTKFNSLGQVCCTLFISMFQWLKEKYFKQMNPPTLLYLPLCLWAAPESLLLGEGMPLTGRQPCKRAHNGSYRDLPASGYSCGKNPQSYTLTIQKLGLVLTALGGWLNKGNRLFPSSLKPLNIKGQQTSKGKNRLLLLWFSFN